MPIVNVTTWPTERKVKEELITELTNTVHKITCAPLDKITVYIQEVNSGDWGEAGILGSDPEFRAKSRRQQYD